MDVENIGTVVHGVPLGCTVVVYGVAKCKRGNSRLSDSRLRPDLERLSKNGPELSIL